MTTPCRMLVLLLSCALSAPVCAITLYRGDDRPPGQVFFEGLLPEGTNANPLEHLSGENCNAPHLPRELRSGYVALTRFESNAVFHGNYVYHVTPDLLAPASTATFDVSIALAFLFDRRHMYGLDLRQSSVVESLVRFYDGHGVHISRRIPGEWIRAVDIYEWDETLGRPTLVGTERNPRYRAPQDIGSQSMFVAEMITAISQPPPPVEVIYMRTPGGREMPVCLVQSQNCSEPSGPMRLGATPMQCASKSLVSPGSAFGQALQILLD